MCIGQIPSCAYRRNPWCLVRILSVRRRETLRVDETRQTANCLLRLRFREFSLVKRWSERVPKPGVGGSIPPRGAKEKPRSMAIFGPTTGSQSCSSCPFFVPPENRDKLRIVRGGRFEVMCRTSRRHTRTWLKHIKNRSRAAHRDPARNSARSSILEARTHDVIV